MSITLNDNIGSEAPKPLDSWRGPYTGADEASAITAACDQQKGVKNSVRYIGRQVDLVVAGTTEVYYWKSGLTDADLVPFTAESQINQINTIPFELAGGANAIKIVNWDEFTMGITVKLDKYRRPLNAFLDYYILSKDIADCKTDAVNTTKNYLSQIPQLEYYVLQPIWYMTTDGAKADTTKIYPALGSVYRNLDPALNSYSDPRLNQWSVNGLNYSTAKKFDTTTLLGGSVSDDGIIEYARFISGLGIKVAIDAWFIGINEDAVQAGSAANPQRWRGYITPDTPNSLQVQITNFQAFAESYLSFATYYPRLLYNNSIDLSICYIGSEFASISTTTDEPTRRKWIDLLVTVARKIKQLHPDCKTVYAGNWQSEYNYQYYRTTMDELLASPYLDYVGFDYYPGITEIATDDPTQIAKGLVTGESADYFYDNFPGGNANPLQYIDYNSQQKLSTTYRNGKAGLMTSPISGNVGDKNIAGFLNKHHYNKNADSSAGATLLPGTQLSAAFTNVTLTKTDGSLFVPQYNGARLLYGNYNIEYADAPEIDLCYADLNDHGIKFNYSYPVLNEKNDVVFKAHCQNGIVLNGNGVLAFLPGRFKILFDASNSNHLTIQIFQNDGSFVSVATSLYWQPSTIFDIELSLVNDISAHYAINNITGLIIADSGKTFSRSWSIGTSPNNSLYLGSDDAGANVLGCKLNYVELSESRFGYAAFFEEGYAKGTRTCYTPKPGMATEFGIAAVSGATVQSNAFPFTSATFDAPSMDFPDWLANKTYWNSFADNGVYIKEVYGPYGSDFGSDEKVQAIGNTIVNNFLKGRGFDIRVLYCAELRPPEVFRFVLNGRLYYIDSPGYAFGHNIVGKICGGTGTGNIISRITVPPIPELIGEVINTTQITDFSLTGILSGNTAATSYNNNIRFTQNSDVTIKPAQPYTDGPNTLPNITYRLPCLENTKYTKSNCSQYTLYLTANIVSNGVGAGIGVGIRGKNRPYYESNSFAIVNTRSGKCIISTVRCGNTVSNADGSVTASVNYQTNGDKDLISDLALTIDPTKPIQIIYQRNVFYYTWTFVHNGQTIIMHQPEGWLGGGKIGTPSIINIGGDYEITEFRQTYDIAKEVDWVLQGDSVLEGDETTTFRALPSYRVAFNAEGGNRTAEYVGGGMADLEQFSKIKYMVIDPGVNDLNFISNSPASTPGYYDISQLKTNHQAMVTDAFTRGVLKLFIRNMTPNNLNFDPRPFNQWIIDTYGPASAHPDKANIVIVDVFSVLNDPNLNSGWGYKQGLSADSLHPTDYGYQLMSERELSYYRPYITLY